MRLPSRVDLDGVGVAGGHVDVEQRAVRQRDVVDPVDDLRGESGGGLELEGAAEPEVHLARERLLRHRDARHAEHDPLQRGRDGARVGDVVAQVGAVVDAGHDEVGLEVADQAEVGEPHAVDRGAVARVADGAVVERHLGHPQRPPRGDRAGGGGHVGVRRDHGELDVVQRDQRAPERLQTLGVDAVVVGEEHAQHRTVEDRDRPISPPRSVRFYAGAAAKPGSMPSCSMIASGFQYSVPSIIWPSSSNVTTTAT